MGLLSSLNIKGKLFVVGLIVCVLMIVVCIFSMCKLRETVSLTAKIQSQTYTNLNMTNQIKINWNAVLVNTNGLMIAGNSADFDLVTEDYLASYANLVGSIKEYSKISDEATSKTLVQIEKQVGKFNDEVKNNLISNIKDNNVSSYIEFKRNVINKSNEIINSFISNLIKNADDSLNNSFSELKDSSSLTWIVFDLIVVFALSMLLVSMISHRIVNHINFINNKCKRVSEGDLTIDLESKDSFDELSDLSRSMQKLINRQHKTISETVEVSDSFYDISKKSGKISMDISRAAGDVVSQSMAVAAASDELVSTTSDITVNCRNAAINSEEAKKVTVDGMDAVKATVDRIREQSQKNRNDSAAVFSLGQKMQHIDAVVTTIQEIAEQTNLLALNASIEAARAGEHGRGFAVVADEVRALAARTTQSTQEITEMVKSIHDETENATNSMADSVSSMDAVADDAQKLESSLSKILEIVNSVNEQISQIAKATEQQSSTTSDISNNMRHITTSVQSIAKEANTQTNVVEELNQMAGKLKNSCKVFNL